MKNKFEIRLYLKTYIPVFAAGIGIGCGMFSIISIIQFSFETGGSHLSSTLILIFKRCKG